MPCALVVHSTSLYFVPAQSQIRSSVGFHWWPWQGWPSRSSQSCTPGQKPGDETPDKGGMVAPNRTTEPKERRIKMQSAPQNITLRGVYAPAVDVMFFYFIMLKPEISKATAGEIIWTKRGLKNAIWIMIGFMQKKNEYITYMAHNLNASFFIFISGTRLTNNPPLQWAKHFTLHARKWSRFLLITRDIINIFCLNWNSNPIQFFPQVGCGQRTSR